MKRETFTKAATHARLPSNEPQVYNERPSHMCAAHGCPMWGSMSDQVIGEVRQRWCRFHFGEGGRHLDAITSALRRNVGLVQEVQRLRARCASGSADPDDRPAMAAAENALAVAIRVPRA